MGKQKTKVSALAKHPGGIKTPPYSTIGKGDVGGDACIAPQVAAHLCGPMTSIGPYSMGVEEFRPRRGQSGKREKSVKKNAALLHFLGFFPLTLLFGVPRGGVPPLGGVRCLATARLFRFLFGHKKEGLKAICSYIEVSAAWWRNTESAEPKNYRPIKLPAAKVISASRMPSGSLIFPVSG